MFASTLLNRATTSFCVLGMPPREEMLLKSFVRLLDHIVHHQWLYYSAADAPRAEVVVVLHGHVPELTPPAGRPPQFVLTLGTEVSTAPFFLHWPLHPNELTDELNRLGELVAAQRLRQAQAAEKKAAEAQISVTAAGAPGLRLQQWPPPILLTKPGRMRLATLLSSRAMDLAELERRSALPAAVCKAFVEDMQRAGLLVAQVGVGAEAATPPLKTETPANLPTAPAQAVHAVAPASLLARIRLRLGLT